MTSLAKVYDSTGRKSQRNLYTGTALFATGGILVIAGILFSTTNLLVNLDLGYFVIRRISGLLAGLGFPIFLLGVFAVLPTTEYQRASAIVGASISAFGVFLFWYAYPYKWIGATSNHITLFVVIIYFLGSIVILWSLFTSVVNFKTRNDPGGTVILQRIVNGKTQLIEVPKSAIKILKSGTPDDKQVGTVGVFGKLSPTNLTPDASNEDVDVDRL